MRREGPGEGVNAARDEALRLSGRTHTLRRQAETIAASMAATLTALRPHKTLQRAEVIAHDAYIKANELADSLTALHDALDKETL